MLLRFLQARRDFRRRVVKEASDLTTFLGDRGYDEARARARKARSTGDRSEAKFWSGVAVEIARRTGRQIGEKVADRYEAAPASRTPAERETIDGIVDIASAIADLARGRGDATTLHNLKARVLQIADAAGNSPEVAHAVAELCRAAERLSEAADANGAALASGAYPPHAEAAGAALQRFRDLVLRS